MNGRRKRAAMRKMNEKQIMDKSKHIFKYTNTNELKQISLYQNRTF